MPKKFGLNSAQVQDIANPNTPSRLGSYIGTPEFGYSAPAGSAAKPPAIPGPKGFYHPAKSVQPTDEPGVSAVTPAYQDFPGYQREDVPQPIPGAPTVKMTGIGDKVKGNAAFASSAEREKALRAGYPGVGENAIPGVDPNAYAGEAMLGLHGSEAQKLARRTRLK